jgi:hypothetical protein
MQVNEGQRVGNVLKGWLSQNRDLRTVLEFAGISESGKEAPS